MRKRANWNRIAAAILTMCLLIPAPGTSAFAASSVNITKEANELQLDPDQEVIVDDDPYASEQVIITLTTDGATIYDGNTFRFSATASGTDLTYLWQYSDDAGSTWTDTDCTEAEYTGTAELSMNGRQYRCIATNKYGTTAASDAVTLTVLKQAAVTSQPSDITVYAGKTYTFAITAEGTGLTYQWQYSDNNGSSWTNASGNAASASYTGTAELSRNGRLYRCQVTDEGGNTSVSGTAKLTVKKAVSITSQPSAVTLYEGHTYSFSVSAEGSGLTYLWLYSTDGGSSWISTGCTTSSIVGTATASMDGRLYRCMVTDEGGNTALSNTAALTVHKAVVITSQPKNLTVYPGQTFIFAITAEGTDLHYTWLVNIDGGSYWYELDYDQNNISETAVDGISGWQFKCIVTDGDGNSITSDIGTLTVIEKESITSQPSNVSVNEGQTFVFAVAAEGSGLTYQWQESADGGSAWTNISCTSAKYTGTAAVSMNGHLYRCVVTDSVGTKLVSNSAKLTVNKIAAITSQPSDVTVYEGKTFIFAVSAEGTGLTYKWQTSTDGSTWTDANCTAARYTGTAASAMNGNMFRCIVTDGAGNSVTSNSAKLIVNKKAAITSQPANVTVYEGKTFTFAVSAEGTGITYRWQTSTDGTTWTDANCTVAKYTGTATTAMNGNQYRCVVTDGAGNTVTSNSAKLTVNKNAVITSQPVNVTVYEGKTFTFAVSAEGIGISYKWQTSTNGSTWTDANCTAAQYTGTAASAMNGNLYRCIVTDGAGNTVTSNSAKLTVNKNGVITSQPVDVTVYEGKTFIFAVSAEGTDLTYQWQTSTNGSTWTDANCTAAQYTGTAASAMNGNLYRCVVIDGAGNSVTSNSAKLTVNKNGVITSQPVDATVYEGKSFTFAVSAEGTGISYKWQTSTNGSTWTDANCTAAQYTGTAASAMNGNLYRCVVTDGAGNSVTSNSAKLTVNKNGVITSQPANVTVYEGKTFTFAVSAEGTGLTYKWQTSTDGNTWTDTTCTAAKYTGTATTAMNGNQYRCVVTDGAGNTVTSNSAKLTVNKNAVITSQPANVTVYEGKTFTFAVSAEGIGITYKWQISTDGNTWTDTSCTASQYTGTAATVMNGNVFRCVVTDGAGNTVTSNSAKLTVNKSAVITSQPADVTVYEGKTFTFSVTATGTDLTYKWQTSTNGSTWTDANCTAAQYTGTAASAMNGNQYRCVVTDGAGNSVTSNSAKLTVNKKASITSQPADVTVYEGTAFTIAVTAAGTDLTYQWQTSADSGKNWSNIASTGASYIGIATADMNGNQYRCIVTDGGGNAVTSAAASLTVNKKVVITSQPQNLTVSLGEIFSFTVGAEGTDLSYTWLVSIDGGSYWYEIHGYGDTIYEQAVDTFLDGWMFKCTVTDAYGNSVTSDTAVLSVR